MPILDVGANIGTYLKILSIYLILRQKTFSFESTKENICFIFSATNYYQNIFP
jgi:hypothetical protein